MPRSLLVAALAVCSLLVVPGPRLAAQVPLAAGRATALGLGGMTEARAVDATYWNPALAAFDSAPAGSSRFLSLSLSGGPVGPLRSVGPLLAVWPRQPVAHSIDTPAASALAQWAGQGTTAGFDGIAQLEWAGFHADGVAITASSAALSSLRAPARAVRIMAGDTAAIRNPLANSDLSLALQQHSQSSIVSTVAISRGETSEHLPLLGNTWLGLTGKFSFLHSVAAGSFIYGDADGLTTDAQGRRLDPNTQARAGDVGVTYDQLELRGGRGTSLDLGMVATPSDRLTLSATWANFYQHVWVDGAPVRETQYVFAGADTAGHTRVRVTSAPIDPAVLSDARRADIAALLATAHFLPVLRLGGTYALPQGRLVGGVALPTSAGDALDRAASERLSLGFIATTLPYSPRLSVSTRFDGSRSITAGIVAASCTRMVGLSAGVVRPAFGGLGLNVGVSFGLGAPPCGLAAPGAPTLTPETP